MWTAAVHMYSILYTNFERGKEDSLEGGGPFGSTSGHNFIMGMLNGSKLEV